MKTSIKYLAAFAFAATALAACDKDGDTIYVDKLPDTTVNTTAEDIVLDVNNLDVLALTVYWDENGSISLSDPEVAAPNYALTNIFQFSASEDFTPAYEQTMADGVTHIQFTAGELNSVALRGGMESGSTARVYVRLKSVLGDNIAPRYSNVISFNLTTYMVDLTIGTILDSTMAETGRTLALTDRADVYAGFYNAGSWENWYFRDPTGGVWGTAADPGKAFVLGNSSKTEIWNNWFPEPAGCYYTTVDIPGNEWTALLIPSLTLGGDLAGEMTYDRSNNIWNYTFAAEAKTYSVTISGTGSQYNQTGGDAAPAAEGIAVGFGGTADALTFGSTATPVNFTVATAGETTLQLKLADPKKWTLGTGDAAPVEEIPQFIYLPGIVDPWGFEDYLRLYNEDNRSYGGVHYVKSEWGYQVAVEKDNWSDVYKMEDGGTPYEGKLTADSPNNIAAPAEGVYIFDISMRWLSYSLTPLTKVSATGMNDDWNLHEMTATETPGVYTYEFEKTAETPWGVKIVFNDNWDLFYGGNGTEGELCYKHDGFTGDNDFETGSTVVLTVDLFKATYTYSKK